MSWQAATRYAAGAPGFGKIRDGQMYYSLVAEVSNTISVVRRVPQHGILVWSPLPRSFGNTTAPTLLPPHAIRGGGSSCRDKEMGYRVVER